MWVCDCGGRGSREVWGIGGVSMCVCVSVMGGREGGVRY